MAKRLVIDPITRIEGHLRIETEIENGKVVNAYSIGTTFRGIEVILKGRTALDAWLFAQRICGVCTTVHAMACVRSVEDATNTKIPLLAQLIRNLILMSHTFQDNIVHFYHLTSLDWVDITKAAKADPKKAAKLAANLYDWPTHSVDRFKEVKELLNKIIESGKLGIFVGYWGHPAYDALPPEIHLILVSHYLEAFDYQRFATQANAVIGGKNPHIQSLVPGGVSLAINKDNPSTFNMERAQMYYSFVKKTCDFIKNVFFRDAIILSKYYKDWFNKGKGIKALLATPDLPTNVDMTNFDLPGGYLPDSDDLSNVEVFKDWKDPNLRNNIKEDIYHAWYKGAWAKHPWEETTEPEYTGINYDGKYSWIKGPLFKDKPAQVGPVAQVLIGYATGHKLIKKYTIEATNEVGIPVGKLNSTIGRNLARAIRVRVLSDLLEKHFNMLIEAMNQETEYCVPVKFSGEQKGVGFHEAPRGILSHWTVIQGPDGILKNYQAVVPSTWNARPRTAQGEPGSYEAALMDNIFVIDPEKPVEILRTVHSFDPCMACAVHLYDEDRKKRIFVQAKTLSR